jgi:hypothetical protein
MTSSHSLRGKVIYEYVRCATVGVVPFTSNAARHFIEGVVHLDVNLYYTVSNLTACV